MPLDVVVSSSAVSHPRPRAWTPNLAASCPSQEVKLLIVSGKYVAQCMYPTPSPQRDYSGHSTSFQSLINRKLLTTEIVALGEGLEEWQWCKWPRRPIKNGTSRSGELTMPGCSGKLHLGRTLPSWVTQALLTSKSSCPLHCQVISPRQENGSYSEQQVPW